MGMDQQALNKAYDQSQYAPNMQEVLARYASASETVRTKFGRPAIFSYGELPIEEIELFSINDCEAATEIFIHGGAWRGGVAKNYSFLAQTTIAAGINLAIVDFSAVQESPDGLFTMVDQIKRAIDWLDQHAIEIGINKNKFYLTGHSSGAHLVASAITTSPDLPINAAICCSGIYELAPVRLSSRNEYLHLSEEMVQCLSPQRHIQNINVPLKVVYGEFESPEFIRQAVEFTEALRQANKNVELAEVLNVNHFEILERYALWWRA
jgi:arylformamidase